MTRRVQRLLTVLLTVLVALVIGPLALLGVDRFAAHTHQRAEHDARTAATVAQVVGRDDTWWVDTQQGTASALGRITVEPPTLSLADTAARDGEADLRLSQNGIPYLVHAVRIDDTTVVVAAVALDEYLAEITIVSWVVAGGVSGAVGLVGLLTWVASGRLLRRVHRALDAQRDFLADAAHELRTPLAVIQASASHALSRERDVAAYVGSLAEIYEAASRAGNGVGELLELARLQSGHAQPRLAPLRMDLLAEEVASSVRADGCSVVAVPSARAVIVEGDLVLLRQAIGNLVTNASRRASHVELRTVEDGGEAVLTVADNGPGFDPQTLPTAFQRFRRGDRRGSYGLGLAIVQHVATAHRGRCEIENRPDRGAVVTLRLPLSLSTVSPSPSTR